MKESSINFFKREIEKCKENIKKYEDRIESVEKLKPLLDSEVDDIIHGLIKGIFISDSTYNHKVTLDIPNSKYFISSYTKQGGSEKLTIKFDKGYYLSHEQLYKLETCIKGFGDIIEISNSREL